MNRYSKIFVLVFVFVIFLASCEEDDKSNTSDEGSFDILSTEQSLYSDISDFSFDEDFSEVISQYTSFESDTESFQESSIESSEHSMDKESADNSEFSQCTNSSEFFEESSENNNSENSSLPENPSFSEPLGTTHTTKKGNVFRTNCTDEDILLLMEEIADTASKYEKATVYYTDTNQKYFFSFGEQNVHNTASTIKAPYAMYILKSGADLSEVLVLEKRHILTGSGVLKNKEAGSKFTVKELIRYMITRSDNTAYCMLLERFGTKGFREYAQSVGVDYHLPSGGYTTCTIDEMAKFMFDIYNYQGTENGDFLIDCMKNCSYSLQISKAVSHKVAHKFGFIYEGKGFHDMAIVYAPTPYLELIFTRINGTVYDTKGFLEIGKLVDKLNTQLSEK